MITLNPVPPGSQPDNDSPEYVSTRLRHPALPPLRLPPAALELATELAGPRFDPAQFPPHADLSRGPHGEAQGERIIVAGRITDEAGRPVPHTMVEVWQANAGGRYDHARDGHDAPLDPNFHGTGRMFTDEEGRYRFVTIKPGAYPWRNHHNAWRPNHIHFSLFGPSFASRLITQMYFPGDPLLALDPIFQATADAAARERLVSRFDLDTTQPEWALGYHFDIVLRGSQATPFEDHIAGHGPGHSAGHSGGHA